MTTDTRLGTVEGRVEEHTAAIADLREGQREIHGAIDQLSDRIDRLAEQLNGRIDQVNGRIDQLAEQLNGRIDQVNGRIDQLAEQLNGRIDQVNSRIDRLFYAILGIGAAQIALLVTLVFRS